MSVERICLPLSNITHNNIITVTGVSASGKDYLINMASKYQPSLIHNRITLFQFGSELAQIITSDAPELLSDGRDGLKTLPPRSLEQYVEKTLQKLIGLQPAVQLTHLVVNQLGKLVINPKSENITQAKAYIFVWADPALIYSWRIAELALRNRYVESIDNINFHQEIALATTIILARKLSAGMFIVSNNLQDTEENIAQINQLVEQLLIEK